jgi:hypothetical protein
MIMRMPHPDLLAKILIMEYLILSYGYYLEGNIKRAIYWLAASVLTHVVTF